MPVTIITIIDVTVGFFKYLFVVVIVIVIMIIISIISVVIVLSMHDATGCETVTS